MKTKNYFLKEIEQSNINNIYKGLSNTNITKYYGVHFSTLEDTKEQMEWYRNLKKNGTGFWWGIYNKTDKQFCGAAGFNNFDKQHKKAEIGLWLLEIYWGKGILKEVMPRLFEEGFTKFNLNRIEGYIVSKNKKCKKAVEKINFTYEGTLREYEIKNNEKIDVDVYAMLKSDWNK